MHIKILVLGITGNLAELKILPGIAQFAEQAVVVGNTVELIGYSRSVPNHDIITHILNNNSTVSKHVLTKVSFVQGEYTDLHMYSDLISSLQEDERLWVYLAVPPSVYLSFLQQSCPYSKHPILLFIEKPFGATLHEMHKIKAVVEACDLHQKVYFVDHYRFKSAVMHQPEIRLDLDLVSKIIVEAYETVGVEDRLGYYASIGAVKDMMVHLFSLTELELTSLTSVMTKIDSIKLVSAIIGQYASIQQDLPPTVPTYFDLKGTLKLSDNTTLDFEYASGKKFATKLTTTTVQTNHNTLTEWQLAPQPQLINNSIVTKIADGHLDHTNLFNAAIEEKFQYFLQVEDALRMTQLEESILDQIISLEGTQYYQSTVYADNSEPLRPPIPALMSGA
jgi:glucose-6-phosphate 1-dehydrogenase